MSLLGRLFGGLGATRWRWSPAVSVLVEQALSRHPSATANTYVCHPWCGWGRFSVDFWGPEGRGDPIDPETAVSIREFLLTRTGPPFIRHWIYQHTLWTSFGGFSVWSANDHSGRLQHLHVTYWRP